MILDANTYRRSVTIIKSMTEGKTYEERLELVSRLSIASSIPVVLVYAYLSELYGNTEEMQNRADGCKEFYGVTDVINIRPFVPTEETAK